MRMEGSMQLNQILAATVHVSDSNPHAAALTQTLRDRWQQDFTAALEAPPRNPQAMAAQMTAEPPPNEHERLVASASRAAASRLGNLTASTHERRPSATTSTPEALTTQRIELRRRVRDSSQAEEEAARDANREDLMQ